MLEKTFNLYSDLNYSKRIFDILFFKSSAPASYQNSKYVHSLCGFDKPFEFRVYDTEIPKYRYYIGFVFYIAETFN